MTRYGARMLFGLAVVSVVAVLALVGAAALTPKSAVRLQSPYIGLVSFASLHDGVPARVTMYDEVGLDAKARDLRSQGLYTTGSRAHQDDLPIWVVKSGSSVRAFIAIDPRNGCNLEVITGTLFHDVCHGSIYTLAGEHAGGPSPWTLDQLVVSIRGGIVYADRHQVLPGRLIIR